ncbi:hypothetical protein Vafri_17071 [Volvox africanus]|uniref:Uncharacterized protein n=1 Tax=Volvox africanus TaxID=51714 RepID=A0A8J4BJA2_9CHLO|nr:hypothetical protein Vafri_17071 [Volvox africanus]
MTSTVVSEPIGKVDHLIKLVIVGSAGVGKTCLIRRLFTDQFHQETVATIERFRALTANYYRGAQCVVLVYDVTQRSTLDAIAEQWLPDFNLHCTFRDAVKMVIGNKIDMVDARVVTPEEGAAFAREHGCMYMETSARTDEGVYDAFVWGVLQNIVDTPSLLRSNNYERLDIEKPVRPDGEDRGRRRRRWWQPRC